MPAHLIPWLRVFCQSLWARRQRWSLLQWNGKKAYRFTIHWGEERDTDDAEGQIVGKSQDRPTPDQIKDTLPLFTGLTEQVPPIYSAIKVGGTRAYDLARSGDVPKLKARLIMIDELTLT